MKHPEPSVTQWLALASCCISFVTLVAGGAYLHVQQVALVQEAETRNDQHQAYTAATCADVRFILKHLIAADRHVASALAVTHPDVANFRRDEANVFATYPATVCQSIPEASESPVPVPRATVKVPLVPTDSPKHPQLKPRETRR